MSQHPSPSIAKPSAGVQVIRRGNPQTAENWSDQLTCNVCKCSWRVDRRLVKPTEDIFRSNYGGYYIDGYPCPEPNCRGFHRTGTRDM